MGTAELFLLAVGLSMDALAVALCKGLALGKLDLGRALWVGLWFGGFQGLMPLAGWALGAGFARSIAAIDHWVAFLLLGWLGGNMLCTARADEPEDSSAALDLRAMLPEHPLQFLISGWEEDLPEKLSRHKLDLDIHHGSLTAQRVARLHSLGITVNCWTCNDPEKAEALIAMGVDQITSNILE